MGLLLPLNVHLTGREWTGPPLDGASPATAAARLAEAAPSGNRRRVPGVRHRCAVHEATTAAELLMEKFRGHPFFFPVTRVGFYSIAVLLRNTPSWLVVPNLSSVFN